MSRLRESAVSVSILTMVYIPYFQKVPLPKLIVKLHIICRSQKLKFNYVYGSSIFRRINNLNVYC